MTKLTRLTWEKRNQPEKNKANTESLRKTHKEFIKNNKLIVKTLCKDLKVKRIMFLLKKLKKLL